MELAWLSLMRTLVKWSSGYMCDYVVRTRRFRPLLFPHMGGQHLTVEICMILVLPFLWVIHLRRLQDTLTVLHNHSQTCRISRPNRVTSFPLVPPTALDMTWLGLPGVKIKCSVCTMKITLHTFTQATKDLFRPMLALPGILLHRSQNLRCCTRHRAGMSYTARNAIPTCLVWLSSIRRKGWDFSKSRASILSHLLSESLSIYKTITCNDYMSARMTICIGSSRSALPSPQALS